MPPPIVQAVHFTGESLSEEERAEASRISKVVTGAFVKGLFHRLEPAAVALDGDVAGAETPAAVAIQRIAAPEFERMKPKLVQLRGDTNRIKALTGLTFDSLKSAGAIRMPVIHHHLLKPTTVPKPPQVPKPQKPSKPPPPKYNRLDLNLRRLHCVDETNPEGGADSMVLGAMRIGASLNVDYTPAIVAGDYDDGDARSFGELYFGSVSLRSTTTWPKTFYWIFQLVESDSDDAEVAQGVTGAVSIVAAAFGTYFGGPAAGALVKAIIDALGGLLGVFIDEDIFPPYGVVIKLNSENDLGSDGIRDEHTGNITGHGGAYRIGYRLRLV